jgi:plastocyanin
MKRLALILAIFTLLLVACGRPSVASTSNSNLCPAGNVVYTSLNMFEQSCITLPKGDTLTVVQDQTAYHVFDYGYWNGTTAQPQAAPAGAPAMKDLVLSGPNVSIGPFTAAGTYYIYCTLHPGMTLTVVVE